jgi:hypothetical protein
LLTSAVSESLRCSPIAVLGVAHHGTVARRGGWGCEPSVDGLGGGDKVGTNTAGSDGTLPGLDSMVLC